MTPQKILAVQNFVGIFQKFLDFFYSNSEKNIIFRTRFSRKILLNDFFCLGTQPSQFIKVLNIGVLHPYQHVKHKINLTIRPGITWMFLKFHFLVDTDSWRHFLRQLVRFSLAFPLDSSSRTARTRSHVQCWQLSSLGIDLKFRYPLVMQINNLKFRIPTP